MNGVHYGVFLQWGPTVLMYSKKAFPVPPTPCRGRGTTGA
jgi:spermidine/putrescine-binding protein